MQTSNITFEKRSKSSCKHFWSDEQLERKQRSSKKTNPPQEGVQSA